MINDWFQKTLYTVLEESLVALEGLGLAVGRCIWLLYTNNRVVGSQDPEWLQGALNVLIGLFCRYGLVTNVAKSKARKCQTGTLLSRILEEAVGRKCIDRGETYRKRPRIRIPWPECRVEITVGSMAAHRRRMHSTEPYIDWNRLPVSHTEHTT